MLPHRKTAKSRETQTRVGLFFFFYFLRGKGRVASDVTRKRALEIPAELKGAMRDYVEDLFEIFCCRCCARAPLIGVQIAKITFARRRSAANRVEREVHRTDTFFIRAYGCARGARASLSAITLVSCIIFTLLYPLAHARHAKRPHDRGRTKERRRMKRSLVRAPAREKLRELTSARAEYKFDLLHNCIVRNVQWLIECVVCWNLASAARTLYSLERR